MLAPTLLVGLGGIGSKIVSRVAKRVSEEVPEELQNRIAYAVFDTDINELQEIHQKNPRVTPIQTSTKLTVGEYLNVDEHAREDWFPVNPILNSKTLTEGAGQVRAISRLALETAIRAGKMEPLHQTVESLYKLEQNQAEQALRIVVASSLCGGTGSGLILPVALYLRNFLSTRFRQSANIMRGFFIMPEVFYHVIHGETERNNLRCNAYATIRELDAFLMKGDGTLPSQFRNKFGMKFPRPGSDEFEEYNVRPYDFCFLFDAQNSDGRKLNDFNQYLDHAAMCIYSQSIGPMNKRSNSSEDNTIRELCAERGRNRYAGAGSASIVYPLKDVEEYIALNWTKQSVSDSWLQFDKLFEEKGKTKEARDRVKDYCTSIENANESNKLAKYIKDQCIIPPTDALESGKPKWEAYVDALCEEARNRWTNLDEIYADIEDCVKKTRTQSGTPDDSVIRNTLMKLNKAAKELCVGIEMMKTDCAKSVFSLKPVSANIKNDEIPSYDLLKFIQDNGKVIHPNAIRFFLYKANAEAEERLKDTRNQLSDGTKGLKHDVENLSKELDNVCKNKKGLIGGDTDKLENKDKAISTIKNGAETLTNYKTMVLQEAILEYANGTYLKNLCESFGKFYDSLKEGIDGVEKKTRIISKKYMPVPGRTTRYVCASQTLLEKMVVANPYMGDSNAVDEKLSLNIFNKIMEYAELSLKDPEKRQGFFTGMFDDQIVGYYKKVLREAQSPKLYMNVIDAMEREIELENNEADPSKITQAVSDIIADTRKMAAPFIETPLGEQRPPIEACSYNPKLDPGDDSPRAALIGKVLKNFGAVPDDDIPPEMLLFYQAVYGLRANNLSKFAPPKQLFSSNEVRSAGEYFKAYFDIVNQVVPKTERTPVITPHIDKTWHIINVLPELDDQNQKDQEDRIYKAFLYGWLYNRIKYSKHYRGNIYKLNLKGATTEEFVVSNKTPCDRYYEVLDALIINPVIVKNIIDYADEKIDKELNRVCNLKFANSFLNKALSELHLKEDGSRTEDGILEDGFDYDNLTIIELPIILKQSAPPSEFRSEVGTDMVVSMFRTMLDYIKRMTSPMEVPDEFGKFVKEQYEQFKANFSRYAKFEFTEYYWALIRAIVDMLQSDEFADTGLYEDGEWIEDDFDKFCDAAHS